MMDIEVTAQLDLSLDGQVFSKKNVRSYFWLSPEHLRCQITRAMNSMTH